MYGIFSCIYHNIKPNVGKYSIHGASGLHANVKLMLMIQMGDKTTNTYE